MNLFVLDSDPWKAARYHVDKHVVKMPLETAQMLSTAHRVFDPKPPSILYNVTHKNHPCSVWIRESTANYEWAFEMFHALAEEYHWRYDKRHLSWRKLAKVLKDPPRGLPVGDLTPFARAMPDQYSHAETAVDCYRAYYRQDKARLHKWSHRRIPDWI